MIGRTIPSTGSFTEEESLNSSWQSGKLTVKNQDVGDGWIFTLSYHQEKEDSSKLT